MYYLMDFKVIETACQIDRINHCAQWEVTVSPVSIVVDDDFWCQHKCHSLPFLLVRALSPLLCSLPISLPCARPRCKIYGTVST